MGNGWLLSVVAVVSWLAFLYSLLGIQMAYWVAAVPGNSPEHVRLNFVVWVPAAALTLACSIWFTKQWFTRRES